MNTALTVTVSVVAVLFKQIGLLGLVFRFVRRRMERLIRDRFTADEILLCTPGANYFGRESAALGQVRGNGALVLTRDALHFFLALPRRELTIPLPSVKAVSLPRSHRGKTVFRPLLRVDFRQEDGTADAAAWYVRNPQDWKQALENARQA